MTHVVPRDRALFQWIASLGEFTEQQLTIWAEQFEERAAIKEFEANMPRAQAESEARAEVFALIRGDEP